MIKYIKSFLSDDEAEYFINLFNNEIIKYNEDNVYKFYFLDLMERDLEVEKFKDFSFKKFRVQLVNESINQIENPHRHSNPWSFIIFLNENFSGGEVSFSNYDYKPKKGDMIYFTGNEKHKVNNCIGDRYTLVGFMLNNPLNQEIENSIL